MEEQAGRIDGLEGQIKSLGDESARGAERARGPPNAVDAEVRSGLDEAKLDRKIDRKLNATRPSMLQMLDNRYAPLRAPVEQPNPRVQDMLELQQHVALQFAQLDEQYAFLRSILSNVVKEPSSLAALEQAERSSRGPSKKLRGPHLSLYAEAMTAEDLERVLVGEGSPARWLRKSRSIPVLGGAGLLGGATVGSPSVLPAIPHQGEGSVSKTSQLQQGRWSIRQPPNPIS